MRHSLLPLALLAACQPAPTDRPGDGGGDDVHTDTDTLPPELEALDPTACAAGTFEPGRWQRGELPHTADPLHDRVFPGFAVLDGTVALAEDLADDAALAPVRTAARAALHDAAACDGDAACIRAALFPDAGGRDTWRAKVSVAAADHVSTLRRLGWFMAWDDQADGTFLATVWDDNVDRAIQRVEAHLLGRTALEIDAAVDAVDAALAEDAPLHAGLAALATAALRVDGRDEAARYDPLEDGENAAALARLPSVDWADFRFAAILVPGQGPSDPDVVLSPLSALRCDTAVVRWQAGLAPFLLLSGGHVHPDRTPYAEALEMKRYLIETHAVPEDAILVDPYARHTTTNLRNGTRLLLEAGAPADAVVLVTSDPVQSAYISRLLTERCEEELGYVPWRWNVSLGPTDTCVSMVPDVLFRDGRDPLDP